ncbi:hypothetical protein HK19_12655 [Acetobacter persici]|nr:hypothetical protein HK19_12655 [Acetobacter persici]
MSLWRILPLENKEKQKKRIRTPVPACRTAFAERPDMWRAEGSDVSENKHWKPETVLNVTVSGVS